MSLFARSAPRRRREWQNLRVAVVGCGTIAQAGHLPALEEMGLAPAVLIDRDLSRANALRATLANPGATKVSDDLEASLDDFDAAIVAVPHHLHTRMATLLLGAGKHVLLEKPMATTPEECAEIIAAAEASRGVLSIGLIRRYWQSAEWAHHLIREGGLGNIESFDIADGARAIEVASDFVLRRETSGGGVLMNLGVHVLDEVMWWFGDVASFDYRDDAYGGNEANCELDLVMASGARGKVELSFNRQLRGTAIIRGSRGTIELELYGQHIDANPPSILDTVAGGVRGRDIPESSPRLAPIFAKELGDWLDAAIDGGTTRVPGDAHHQRLAQLIQDCYAQRRELELPWMNPAAGTSVAAQAIEVKEVERALG